MAQKFDRTQLGYMIDHILSQPKELSKWELSFAESVSDQLERNGTLSERQQEIVDSIYVRLP